MQRRVRPVQPGEPAPSITLPAINREGTVALDEFRGRSGVLVGFFRGLHCPFCRRQLVQLAAAQPALQAAGIIDRIAAEGLIQRGPAAVVASRAFEHIWAEIGPPSAVSLAGEPLETSPAGDTRRTAIGRSFSKRRMSNGSRETNTGAKPRSTITLTARAASGHCEMHSPHPTRPSSHRTRTSVTHLSLLLSWGSG